MQDIHALTGGGPTNERIFAAAAAVGDRRLLRPTRQALKCPRCDSVNTKFCYYNNYNLSQPRHFCKSCKRYWTKGGVLRNVPVGGGCRKSKRSSASSTSSSNSKTSSSKTPHSPSVSAAKSQTRDESAVAVTYNNINNNNSSGDSCVIASADIPTLFGEFEYGTSWMEKPATTTGTPSLYGIEGISIDHPNDNGVVRDDVSAGMLTEIGNFPILIGSTAEIPPFGYGGLMSQQDNRHHQPQDRVFVDGFGPLDWEDSVGDSNGGDRVDEFFDVTGTVDHSYWSQRNQWAASGDGVDHQHRQGGGRLFLP